MDNLTHTLFAATLARTSLARAGRGTTATLLLASNAPDIDIVSLAQGPLGYLAWHRGPTHGPLGVIGLGLATAGLVWLVLTRRDARRATGTDAHEPPSFPLLATVGLLGVTLHILMDLPTSYGTRALSPFSDRWFTTDWMPIVDIYLLALLGAGLALARRPSARRWTATVVLSLMAANYGVRTAAHHQAIESAARVFGPRLPPPCADRHPGIAQGIGQWSRAVRIPPDNAGGRCLVEIAAIPTFTSPFRWQVIAQVSNAYETQMVNLLRERGGAGGVPWRLARRQPNQWTPAVIRAADSDVARVFLAFSRYPAARSAIEADGTTTVRWIDMRFAPGPTTPRASPNRRNLFAATVRIAADGTILDQRLGP